ncbi:RfaG Glycosyltransferase [Burkholderiales bacterium]
MKILFLHQNFPGQFKFLAPALATAGHEVTALRLDNATPLTNYDGVRVQNYRTLRINTPGLTPSHRDLESKLIRAEGVAVALDRIRQSGNAPDLIIGHSGWGECLHVKSVFPGAGLYAYCEFYYRENGQDTGFDPEYEKVRDIHSSIRLDIKNFNNDLMSTRMDKGLTPTQWQMSTYPDSTRRKLSVIHEGVDTDQLKRRPEVTLTLTTKDGTQVRLSSENKVVTYVARNLEPYRGFHSFMRAIPKILRADPEARVLLVGGDSVSYGSPPKEIIGEDVSWRQLLLREVSSTLSQTEIARIHFLGKVPYQTYKDILSISSVHVYLTYPFVLSWSMLEAMSMGCCVLGSSTPPVQEVIEDGQNGRLVNFFDYDSIADTVIDLLADKSQRTRLGAHARKTIQDRYDLKRICLPAQLQWVLT